MRRLSGIIPVGSKCHHKWPYKREAGDHMRTHRERWCEARAEKDGAPPAIRSWKKQGTISRLEPLEGVWLCLCLNLEILASRTMGEQITIVLSHPVGGNCYSSHRYLIQPYSDILVVISYYSFARCDHWGKVDEGYTGPLCITAYNFTWIHNYPKIKSLGISGWLSWKSMRLLILGLLVRVPHWAQTLLEKKV